MSIARPRLWRKQKSGTTARILAVLSIFVISCAALVGASSSLPAQAGPTPYAGTDIAGPIYSQSAPRTGAGYAWTHNINGMTEHWLGAYIAPDGSVQFCINLYSPAPTGTGTIVTEFSPNPAPGILGDMMLTNPQMGYIFKLIEDGTISRDDPTSMAAIAFLVHANYEAGEGRAYVQQLILDIMDSSDPTIRTRAAELVSEAKASAAVGVIPGTVSVSDTQMEFTVTGIGTKTESGAWVAGIPVVGRIVDVVGSGVAVFDNGTTTFNGVTGTSGLTVGGRSTGTGTVKIQWEFHKNQVPLELRERIGSQTTLKSSGSDPLVVNVQTVPFDLVFDFQPVVSSKAAAQFVDAGADFVDALTVAADPAYAGGVWTVLDGAPVPVKATTTVYFVGLTAPVASAEPPAGAELVGTVASVFDGAGTKNITVPTGGRTGYFVAQTKIVKADQGAFGIYVHADAQYNFGLANETTIAQISPTVTTVASDKLVVPGSKTSDKVTIHLEAGAKWTPGLTVKAHGTLYGPYDVPAKQAKTVPAGAPVAATADLAFTADGQTLPAAWTAGKVGFYTWVWEIRKADQVNPDLFKQSFTDEFMIQKETTSVRVKELDHTSTAREYNVDADGRAFDEIIIDGFQDSHTTFKGDGYWKADLGTARVIVYDAGAGYDWTKATADVPSGLPVHWETTIKAVNGKYQIGYDDKNPITNFKAGHDYVFVYYFDGDDRVAAFHSPFNDILERFHIPGGVKTPPTVATQAQETAKVGEEFGDTALVMGTVEDGTTLKFEAFGPQAEGDTPSCETPFFTSDPIRVPAAGYYDSPKTSVNSAGLVYWVETLTNSKGEIIWKGECGVPSETTKVTGVDQAKGAASLAKTGSPAAIVAGAAAVIASAGIWLVRRKRTA